MPDYQKMLDWITMPAQAFMAQSPKSDQMTGWMGDIHKAIDPVNMFGGYGGLAAMALPVGRAVPKGLPKDIKLRDVQHEYGGRRVEAVHEPSGEVVGYVRYRPSKDGSHNWIDGMAVKDELQRQGINSAMMDTIKGHKSFAHTTPEGEAFLQSYAKKRGKDDLNWGPGS